MSYSFNWKERYFWIITGRYLFHGRDVRLNRKRFSERSRLGNSKYIDIGNWFFVLEKK